MISVKTSLWKAWAWTAVRLLDKRFPGGSWGTYPGHDPSEALAADCMVPHWQTAAGIAWGDRLANYVARVSVAKLLGIWYVIWRGRIWSMTRPAEGWLPYFDRNNPNPSRSHKNHVHISFYAKAPASSASKPAAKPDLITVTVIKNTPGYWGPSRPGKVRFPAGAKGHGRVGQKLRGTIKRLKDGKYLVTRAGTYYPAQNHNLRTSKGNVLT